MPQPLLHERHAVIVGGTAGIGLATAEALLAAGLPAVAVCGRDKVRGMDARDHLVNSFPGAEIHFVQMDAADASQTEEALAEAARQLGRIDVLLSGAGGNVLPKLLKETPTDTLADVLWAVAGPVITPARAVYPIMQAQGGGSVICIASDACKVATPGETVIGAGMAAIAMFCRGMATEAKRDGIRVNCITPSIVRGTPLYERLQEDPFSSRLFGKAERLAELGVAGPDDIAQLAVFLSGPGADRLTGQTISVNGGISAA